MQSQSTSPPISDLSLSSSDIPSTYVVRAMPNITVITGNQATVIQTAPTKLPILIARDMTVETITS